MMLLSEFCPKHRSCGMNKKRRRNELCSRPLQIQANLIVFDISFLLPDSERLFTERNCACLPTIVSPLPAQDRLRAA
jgi:hypothetical protein